MWVPLILTLDFATMTVNFHVLTRIPRSSMITLPHRSLLMPMAPMRNGTHAVQRSFVNRTVPGKQPSPAGSSSGVAVDLLSHLQASRRCPRLVHEDAVIPMRHRLDPAMPLSVGGHALARLPVGPVHKHLHMHMHFAVTHIRMRALHLRVAAHLPLPQRAWRPDDLLPLVLRGAQSQSQAHHLGVDVVVDVGLVVQVDQVAVVVVVEVVIMAMAFRMEWRMQLCIPRALLSSIHLLPVVAMRQEMVADIHKAPCCSLPLRLQPMGAHCVMPTSHCVAASVRCCVRSPL